MDSRPDKLPISDESPPDEDPEGIPTDGRSGGPDAAPAAPAEPTEPTDPARAALAHAQRGIRSRPRRPTGGRRERAEGRGRNRSGYSGPGPDPARGPQRLATLLDGFVSEQGWDAPLSEGRLFADWSALVGPDVAAHCEPQAVRAGELRIVAESTAWATQLRLLSSTLLARLVAELGPQVVTRLVITGPSTPSWRHGPRSVRGARGPRDTYG